MPDEVVEDLVRAVDAAAATFDGRGSEIRERELEMAVETALWTLGRQPGRQHLLRLEPTWNGRVGGVDLSLPATPAAILIELKWDPKTLAACAWDSVKLAAALQSGEGGRAFLMGGSPSRPDFRGDELLDDAEVEPCELRQRYAMEFDFWKMDVRNHPHSAPAAWRIARRHCSNFEFKGEPWRIRVAEVSLVSPTLVAFE
jgi:hypothetical protein